jgi:hypothetical protein
VTSETSREALTAKIRAALAGRSGVTEQRKMGGTTFLVDGKVCVRDHRGELMARCRPELTDQLLAKPGVRRFEMTGKREMKGWLIIEPGAADAELGFWIETALGACAAVKPRR